jgi:hypothetical protein
MSVTDSTNDTNEPNVQYDDAIREVYHYVQKHGGMQMYNQVMDPKAAILVKRTTQLPKIQHIGDTMRINSTIARREGYHMLVLIAITCAVSFTIHYMKYLEDMHSNRTPQGILSIIPFFVMMFVSFVGSRILGRDVERTFGEPNVHIFDDVVIFRSSKKMTVATLWKSDSPFTNVMHKEPLSRYHQWLLGYEFRKHTYLYVGNQQVGIFKYTDRIISDVNRVLCTCSDQ